MKRFLAVLALIPVTAAVALALAMFSYLMGPFMGVDGTEDGVGWRWDVVWLMWFWIWAVGATIAATIALGRWALEELGLL